MGPLELIRRLVPAAASKAESKLYKDLLAETSARDSQIEKKLQQMIMRNKGDQAELLSSPRFTDLERQQHPLKIARSNLVTARYAAPNDDETARLLLATTPDDSKHVGSMLYRPPGYYAGDRGLPPNGVYIEGLSSELPGGGTQLLKELEAQYPRTPMFLESVNNPDTLEFYVKKGFLPQADRSSDAIPRNLFVKPYDVQVRREGGPVKMAEGGDPDEKRRKKLAQEMTHLPTAPEYVSVLDRKPSVGDQVSDLAGRAIQGGLEALKREGPMAVAGWLPGGRLMLGGQLMSTAGDAEAANWLRLFSGHKAPLQGAYDVAKSTGRMGRGAYVTDSPGYASMRAMAPRAEAPTVYPVDVDMDQVLQLARQHPSLPAGKTWGDVYKEKEFWRLPPKEREAVLDSLGVAGAEYPSHITAPLESNPARMFVIRDTGATKALDGKPLASGGSVRAGWDHLAEQPAPSWDIFNVQE